MIRFLLWMFVCIYIQGSNITHALFTAQPFIVMEDTVRTFKHKALLYGARGKWCKAEIIISAHSNRYEKNSELPEYTIFGV